MDMSIETVSPSVASFWHLQCKAEDQKPLRLCRRSCRTTRECRRVLLLTDCSDMCCSQADDLSLDRAAQQRGRQPMSSVRERVRWLWQCSEPMRHAQARAAYASKIGMASSNTTSSVGRECWLDQSLRRRWDLTSRDGSASDRETSVPSLPLRHDRSGCQQKV